MAVDWNCVVEHNRDALKRILAMMVAMVAAGALTFPLLRGEEKARAQGAVDRAGWGEAGRRDPPPPCGEGLGVGVRSRQTPHEIPPPAPSARPPHKGEASRPTLPRHLYRAVLAILYPAESAARRLIVVAARGLVVPPPRLRPFLPKPRRRPGPSTIVFPHAARFPPPPQRAVPARIALPMFDTLRPPARRLRSVPARLAPRITLPGVTVRHTLPPKPTPFDAIDATRLNLRLETLSAVLDDLPGQALRFARWRARRDARLAALLEARAETPDRRPSVARPAGRPGGRRAGPPAVPPTRRLGRLSPLRPGRAPGSRRRDRREVHEILANLQHFALEVLEAPDTS